MLAYESGRLPKDTELGKATSTEEFWIDLEATPEHRLKPIHLQLFAALGIQPPEQKARPGR